MILKRPYAFLIKYFRIIHLFITIILGYLVIRFRSIYIYLNDVINNLASRYDVINYIDYKIYIYIVIALILCFVIYWLLKYKDKPRRIYMFTIIGYIIIGIYMIVLFNYMNTFVNSIVDQKIIRFYWDTLIITLFFQYYIIIVMFIRTMGFDIKKFNFAKDIQELNVEASDSEEIEVNIGIDTTNVMRSIRKQKREFGYFFKEYKYYILFILLVFLGIVGYRGYSYFNNKYKVYYENQLFGDVNKIIIRDSYYSIQDNINYVIISFSIYKEGKMDKFNTGYMQLLIGNNKYNIDKNKCYMFSYLGSCYKNQYVTDKLEDYILVYEVDNLNIQDAYIIYNEYYDKPYKVKLVMKNS